MSGMSQWSTVHILLLVVTGVQFQAEYIFTSFTDEHCKETSTVEHCPNKIEANTQNCDSVPACTGTGSHCTTFECVPLKVRTH